MFQWLRALAAFAEDWSLVSSIHMEFYNSSSRDLVVPSSGRHNGGHIYTQAKYPYTVLKNLLKTNRKQITIKTYGLCQSICLWAQFPLQPQKSHQVSLSLLRQVCQVLQAHFPFHLQTRQSDGHQPLPIRHSNHRTERPVCSPLPRLSSCLKRAGLRAPARCFLCH